LFSKCTRAPVVNFYNAGVVTHDPTTFLVSKAFFKVDFFSKRTRLPVVNFYNAGVVTYDRSNSPLAFQSDLRPKGKLIRRTTAEAMKLLYNNRINLRLQVFSARRTSSGKLEPILRLEFTTATPAL
jgi:hypothetical protein